MASSPTVGRRILAIGLIAVATVVLLLAIFAIWLNRQALNTDNWAKTSSELLEQPVIQERVATRLTDELFESVDVAAALATILPPRAEPLAGPAANALRDQVEKRAAKALQRPDVQQLWVDANAAAHAQLLDVLDGGGTTVQTANGEVTLNLKDLLAKLQESVGVGGRLRKVLPASATEIRLFQSGELSTAQDVVRVLRPLPIVLLVISLALFAIALAIAPGWRRRGVRALGFGLILAGAGALLIRSVAGDAFVNSLASTAAAEPALTRGLDDRDEPARQHRDRFDHLRRRHGARRLARRADGHRDRGAPRNHAVPARAGDRLHGPRARRPDPHLVGAHARVAQRPDVADPRRTADRGRRGAPAPGHPRVPGRDARRRRPPSSRALGEPRGGEPASRRGDRRGGITDGAVGLRSGGEPS